MSILSQQRAIIAIFLAYFFNNLPLKISSFRLRIALSAALLAGSAVTGFCGISYLFLYQSKAQNLDREIQGRLLREATAPRPNIRWENVVISHHLVIEEEDIQNTLILVLDRDQNVLYQSNNWDPALNPYPLFPPIPNHVPRENQPPNPPPDERNPRPLTPPERREIAQLSPVLTQKTATGHWRIGTVSSPSIQMAIAVNLKVLAREMALIRNVFLLLIPITLLLVLWGAWWLSRSALDSIQNITKILHHVTAKGLDKRASMAGLDTEFIELVTVFNQMMERLERSFQQASRFSADAAHELKTPLAILQGELEQAVQQSPTGSKRQQVFSDLLDEVRRLSAITRKLLLLSLADAGQMRLQKIEINLSQLIQELSEDIDLLAPELALEIQIAPYLKLQGDRDLLTQVLQNLMMNGIKYNVPQGWLKIRATQHQQKIYIVISNASKRIPKGDRQRIFERFHRGDAAHNRKVEGFGLGLSLAREIARAHGGDLTLEPSTSQVTTFRLTLPISG